MDSDTLKMLRYELASVFLMPKYHRRGKSMVTRAFNLIYSISSSLMMASVKTVSRISSHLLKAAKHQRESRKCSQEPTLMSKRMIKAHKLEDEEYGPTEHYLMFGICLGLLPCSISFLRDPQPLHARHVHYL